MKKFHASPKRFEEFDFKKIGTGQENSRYAHGCYLGEKEAIKEYVETYMHLSAADATYYENSELVGEDYALEHGISGDKGISYEVNVPDDVADRVVDWESAVSIEQLNEISIAIYKLKNTDKISQYKSLLEENNFPYEVVNDVDDFIDSIAEFLYDSALEEDLPSSVEKEHIEAYLYRAFRNDTYTQVDNDCDFLPLIDESYVDLIRSMADDSLTLEDNSTHETVYRVVTIALADELHDKGAEDKAGQERASKLLSETLDISGYLAPCMFGKLDSKEVIIINEDDASSLGFKEIPRCNLDYYDYVEEDEESYSFTM